MHRGIIVLLLLHLAMWLEQIPIERLQISGKCTDTERLRIMSRFPDVKIK